MTDSKIEALASKEMSEVQNEFEEFFAKSPFPKSGKTVFDINDIKTAMNGGFLGGMTALIRRIRDGGGSL